MGKKSKRNKQTTTTTSTAKKSGKPPIVFYTVLAVVIICLIGMAVYAKHSQEKANEPKTVHIDTSGQPYMGKKSAPVTIVEFGDYKCPFCKRFTETLVPQIEKNLVDKGKAKFYFINFPFIFNDSTRAAGFAETVYKELGSDTFWKFHEKLYKSQPDGQEYEKKDVYTEEFLTNLLKQVATEQQVTQVLDAFHKDQYKTALDKDMKIVNKLGLYQTPSVFVNGKLFNFTPTSTYNDFKKFVDEVK